MSERIPMTRKGYNKIKAEMEHLEYEEMPVIEKRIGAARSEGDLSENAEYHGARESQGMLQLKIDQLKIKLNQISRVKGMLVIGRYKSALRKALELDPKNVDARVEEIGFLIHAPGIIGGSETKAQEKIDDLKSTHRREAMVMQAELRDKQEDARGAQPEMPTGQATPVPPSPQ